MERVSTRAALAMAVAVMVLPLAQSQVIAFDGGLPQDVFICEGQPVPTMFNLTCQYNTTFFPVWLVTGLSTMPQSISSGVVDGPFIPQGGTGESTLSVDGQEVINGTCFQCELRTPDGLFLSRKGCLIIVGTPGAPTDLLITGSAVTWSPSALGLNHRITVCPVGTSNCTIQTSCIGCMSIPATGLVENVQYNITVCSSGVVGEMPCMSEACASTIADLPGRNGGSSSMTPGPPPPPRIGVIIGCVVGGLIVVTLVVIIIVVAVLVFKHMKKNTAHGEKLTAHHAEEMVDVHGDTNYATPDKDKAAAQGGEGEYSYAATTTVIGAKHSKPGTKPGGEKKVADDVSAQPEKPKRGSKKQPSPSDVPHKQGPVGDLYAMPDKKAPEVEHKAGPQGDMYAVAAKSSKGGYGAEGPN